MKKRIWLLLAVLLLVTVISMTLISCDNLKDNKFDYSKINLAGAYASVVNMPSGTAKVILKLFSQNTYSLYMEVRAANYDFGYVTETGIYSYTPIQQKSNDTKAAITITLSGTESVGYLGETIYVKAGYITGNLLKDFTWIYSVKNDDSAQMSYLNFNTGASYTMSYTPFTYSVVYRASEGGKIQGNTSQSVTDGNDASEVTAVADEDYTFKRWSDGVTEPKRKDTNIKGNIEVTAEFECKYPQYTLIYQTSEGGRIEGKTSQNVIEGRDADEVTAVADEGYAFKRWSDGVTEPKRKDTNVTGNIEVTAEFVRTYNVIYAVGEGGTIQGETSQKIMEGDNTSEVTAIANQGYAFKRWSDGVTEPKRTDINVTENIYVKAEFVRVYNLTFTAGEGGMLQGETSQVVISGASSTAVTAIPNTGYTFSRWEYEIYGTKHYCWTETITANSRELDYLLGMEYKAIFEKTTLYHTVTFDYGNDREKQTIEVSDNSFIKLELPVKVGYTFKGWAKDYPYPSGQLLNAGDTLAINADTIFYATWQINTYDITFDLDGGSLDNAPISFTINDLPLKLPIPRRDGYSFAGYTIKDSDQTIDTIEKDAQNLHNYELVATYDDILDTFVCIYLDELQGYELIAYTGSANNVVIPELYNSKPLTSIGNNVFKNCNNLTSVTIGNSVTSIGSFAFSSCSNLTSVTIGNSVTSIGGGAFWNCSSLTDIYYTGDIASWCGISGLSNLMPYGGTHDLYINGEKLVELIIPDSVTSIGSSAFYNCANLTSITIPDSVTSIGGGAFSNFSNLQYNEYGNCLYLGNSENPYVALIKPKYTFITDCDIADSTKIIADNAFSTCKGLTDITIPDSVISIGNSAFYDCSHLTSITISNGVTSIGTNAFYNCPIENATIPTIAARSITNSNLKTVVITSGDSIGDDAFYGCSSLTSITIPDSVTSIGKYAFYNCRSLTSVTIGNSVTSIGKHAFYNCSSITSVTIPDSVTSIGEIAFYNCSSLTSVTIGNSVTSIGDNAFYGCPIENATIPTLAISSIKNSALKTVVITSGESIGASAFSDCSNLVSVTIPDSVTSIGYNAFRDCSSLTSVTIPDSVTSIGNDAFSDCNNLQYNAYESCLYLGNSKNPYVALIKPKDTFITDCDIADSTKIIADYAFFGYKGLTDITIPDSVISIGNSAFYDCSNLTSITIPDSVTDISDGAFSWCTALSTVYIESAEVANLSSIGQFLQYATDVYILANIELTASIYEERYDNNGEVIVNDKTYIYYKIKGV